MGPVGRRLSSDDTVGGLEDPSAIAWDLPDEEEPGNDDDEDEDEGENWRPLRRKMATTTPTLAFQSDILVGLIQMSDTLPLQSRRVKGPSVAWTTAKNLAGAADYSIGQSSS